MTEDIQGRTIGGSEVYELLERPQYGRGCRRALAYRKLGIEPDFPVEVDDELLNRGTRLEPIAARIYEELTARTLRQVQPNRLHKTYPWARVSTDRLIQAKPGIGPTPGDLELKTRAEGPYRRVQRSGPFSGDLLQIQWSLWVTGHSWGSLGILGVFGSLPMLTMDVKADRELQQIFVRESSSFAEQVFGKGQLPDPTFPPSDERC